MAFAQKIAKLSRILELACWCVLIGIPVLAIFRCINIDAMIAQNSALQNLSVSNEMMGSGTKLAVFLVLILPSAALFYGVNQVRRLLGLYKHGQMFTSKNINCLKNFALSLFLFAFLSPISDTALSLILTAANGNGERAISVGFDDGDLQMFVMAGAFLLISWVMALAQQAVEENQSII